VIIMFVACSSTVVGIVDDIHDATSGALLVVL
jgi:hypothetical protein